jgi:hypothetical protein
LLGKGKISRIDINCCRVDRTACIEIAIKYASTDIRGADIDIYVAKDTKENNFADLEHLITVEHLWIEVTNFVDCFHMMNYICQLLEGEEVVFARILSYSKEEY